MSNFFREIDIDDEDIHVIGLQPQWPDVGDHFVIVSPAGHSTVIHRSGRVEMFNEGGGFVGEIRPPESQCKWCHVVPEKHPEGDVGMAGNIPAHRFEAVTTS